MPWIWAPEALRRAYHAQHALLCSFPRVWSHFPAERAASFQAPSCWHQDVFLGCQLTKGGVCIPPDMFPTRASGARAIPSLDLGCNWVTPWSLPGCLLKQENEEKCHEALLCCTEGLKRCCAAVIQWGKDKSLTYTYAPPRERTLWAEKEQNMKYEFPRAAREGWLSRAFPRRLGRARREGGPLRAGRRWGEGRAPHTWVLLWFSPQDRAPAGWPCLGELPVPQGRGGWWRWFPLWESLGSPNVGCCQTLWVIR